MRDRECISHTYQPYWIQRKILAYYLAVVENPHDCKSEDFFSITILITQIYKTKNITITRYYLIFQVPGKREKNKLKQSEIDVKMITKSEKT